MANETKPMAPCRRCGAPRPRGRGRQFCFDCSLSGTQASRARAQKLTAPGVREMLIARAELGEPLTLDEVGVVLGMTREGVRLIEARALEKLRGIATRLELQP